MDRKHRKTVSRAWVFLGVLQFAVLSALPQGVEAGNLLVTGTVYKADGVTAVDDCTDCVTLTYIVALEAVCAGEQFQPSEPPSGDVSSGEFSVPIAVHTAFPSMSGLVVEFDDSGLMGDAEHLECIDISGVDPVEIAVGSIVTQATSAVDLVSFSAEVVPPMGVYVSWSTATEADTVGFNLWRAVGESGDFVRVTGDLIPAEGGPTGGAEYDWTDADIVAGETYSYKLEEIDLHGASMFHGPVVLELPVLPCGTMAGSPVCSVFLLILIPSAYLFRARNRLGKVRS